MSQVVVGGPGGSMSQVVGLSNNSYKPITNTAWVRVRLCTLQKACTRFAAASNKLYQVLAHGRWFSLGTPASSATKTGRHDIAEILLKVALKYQKFNQIKSLVSIIYMSFDLRFLNTSLISSNLSQQISSPPQCRLDIVENGVKHP